MHLQPCNATLARRATYKGLFPLYLGGWSVISVDDHTITHLPSMQADMDTETQIPDWQIRKVEMAYILPQHECVTFTLAPHQVQS